MSETIVGDDAIIIRVIEKVELAVRRANARYTSSMSATVFADELAIELGVIIKNIRNANPSR